MLLSNTEEATYQFAKTNIGDNLAFLVCMMQEAKGDIGGALMRLATNPRVAVKVAKHDLVSGLTMVFKKTR